MKDFLREYKASLKEMIKDESGAEFLEIAVGIMLAAAVIVVLAKLFQVIINKINDSNDAVEAADTNLDVNGRSGSPSSGGP